MGTIAGPAVYPDRTGISSALYVHGKTYVIDCGLGSVRQFVQAGLAPESLAAIFITHLHADHIADYYNFLLMNVGPWMKAGKRGDTAPSRLQVYGPGPAGGLPAPWSGGAAPTVGNGNPTPGIADLTTRCLEAYAYSANDFMRSLSFPDPRGLMKANEIALPDVGASFKNTAPAMRPFPVMEDEYVKVSAILVPHYDVFPSFAFRFDIEGGKSVVFSGDTRKSDNVAHLATGCDILVHEAALAGKGSDNIPNPDYWRLSHTFPPEVGDVATAAGARSVVLSHLNAGVPDHVWKEGVAKNYRGPITVAADLQRFSLT
ncbi:MBL fold metallo-hydrolase [Streptomyces platensis]|uniref:MBL fold metallo-hydrolase n=1 Tax=Streptomyces platensis TaxID=58346 RepID=UPI001AD6AED6|nr:MBL fold metallo-hydrolase [Streptomyces platensis]